MPSLQALRALQDSINAMEQRNVARHAATMARHDARDREIADMKRQLEALTNRLDEHTRMLPARLMNSSLSLHAPLEYPVALSALERSRVPSTPDAVRKLTSMAAPILPNGEPKSIP
ncbi:hypothetical protein ABW21_db0200791 [Orbilia brochopaga]|nr:hypothetical protein ABW21_db0200791 [Drechslerella brochopaga]